MLLDDNPLYQCFVSPKICQDLVNAGLMVNEISFHWRLNRCHAELFTLEFDEDNYYRQAFKNLEHFSRIELIPAFQIKDMEKLLPDHILSKNNIEYELNCSSLFEFEVQKNTRMPDVYAMMVLKGIEQHKIDPGLAIKKISAKNQIHL